MTTGGPQGLVNAERIVACVTALDGLNPDHVVQLVQLARLVAGGKMLPGAGVVLARHALIAVGVEVPPAPANHSGSFLGLVMAADDAAKGGGDVVYVADEDAAREAIAHGDVPILVRRIDRADVEAPSDVEVAATLSGPVVASDVWPVVGALAERYGYGGTGAHTLDVHDLATESGTEYGRTKAIIRELVAAGMAVFATEKARPEHCWIVPRDVPMPDHLIEIDPSDVWEL